MIGGELNDSSKQHPVNPDLRVGRVGGGVDGAEEPILCHLLKLFETRLRVVESLQLPDVDVANPVLFDEASGIFDVGGGVEGMDVGAAD